MGPCYGKQDPYKLPISLGILMGVGLGNSMGPAYHKGIPCPWGSLESPLICIMFPICVYSFSLCFLFDPSAPNTL